MVGPSITRIGRSGTSSLYRAASTFFLWVFLLVKIGGIVMFTMKHEVMNITLGGVIFISLSSILKFCYAIFLTRITIINGFLYSH
jgi:hypothetical protein